LAKIDHIEKKKLHPKLAAVGERQCRKTQKGKGENSLYASNIFSAESLRKKRGKQRHQKTIAARGIERETEGGRAESGNLRGGGDLTQKTKKNVHRTSLHRRIKR